MPICRCILLLSNSGFCVEAPGQHTSNSKGPKTSLNGPLIPIPHIFRAIPTFLKIQSSFFSCCCLRTSQPESEHACGMDYSLVMWYRLPPSSKPVRKDPVPELCFFIFRADNFCYQERRVIKLRIFLSVLLRPFR